MIALSDQFGPWRQDIDPAERLARLRSMRAIARLCLGPRGSDFADALHRAETDPEHLEPALIHLNTLAALDRRAVLCSFAALPVRTEDTNMNAPTPGLLATVRSIEVGAVRYAAGMVAGGAQTLAIAAALAAQSKELPVSATDLDRQWFKANPGRQYRHRRETPAEIAGWEVPPRTGFTAWRIIRRSDSTSVSYAFPSDAIWDVADEELAALFDTLHEDRA